MQVLVSERKDGDTCGTYLLSTKCNIKGTSSVLRRPRSPTNFLFKFTQESHLHQSLNSRIIEHFHSRRHLIDPLPALSANISHDVYPSASCGRRSLAHRREQHAAVCPIHLLEVGSSKLIYYRPQDDSTPSATEPSDTPPSETGPPSGGPSGLSSGGEQRFGCVTSLFPPFTEPDVANHPEQRLETIRRRPPLASWRWSFGDRRNHCPHGHYSPNHYRRHYYR